MQLPKGGQELTTPVEHNVFGGGSGSDALQAYCEFFKNKYEGISEMQRNWALTCVDKKQFMSPYGITFYFPAEIQRSGYISFTTQIYNYSIQGFATGEIIPLALVYFWHRSKHLRNEIFVTIHDSIDSRVHKDDKEELDKIAVQALTTDVYRHLERTYDYTMTVPLGLGSKAGKHWGDGDETKLDVFPNGTTIDRT